MLSSRIMDSIRDKLGQRAEAFELPPPVFATMQGEFLEFDEERGVLTNRFPVLRDYLNPYGSMQGGMVAAAVDNTFGPLSMLVGPPSFTRRMELKYSSPVTMESGHITVRAALVEREGRSLKFKAEVRDPEGKLLARAWSQHWIVDEEDLST
jgi:acyl-coenzyme A thioesterase PaaI-like protein